MFAALPSNFDLGQVCTIATLVLSSTLTFVDWLGRWSETHWHAAVAALGGLLALALAAWILSRWAVFVMRTLAMLMVVAVVLAYRRVLVDWAITIFGPSRGLTALSLFVNWF